MPPRGHTVELVVARYDEDVEWVHDYVPHVDRITVYDKSATPLVSFHPKVHVVPLPNVGREAHSYAHHFVEHHAHLCDVVVCTQGRFEDHLSRTEFDALVRGEDRAAVPRLDVSWSKTVMGHFGWTSERNHSPDQAMQPCGMTLAKYYLTYVGEDLQPEEHVQWWMGAIFKTTASEVQRHPPAKYAAIRDTLEVGSNPEAAHYMERFWKLMLTPPPHGH